MLRKYHFFVNACTNSWQQKPFLILTCKMFSRSRPHPCIIVWILLDNPSASAGMFSLYTLILQSSGKYCLSVSLCSNHYQIDAKREGYFFLKFICIFFNDTYGKLIGDKAIDSLFSIYYIGCILIISSWAIAILKVYISCSFSRSII